MCKFGACLVASAALTLIAGLALASGMPTNWMPIEDDYAGTCRVGVDCYLDASGAGGCARYAVISYRELDRVPGLTAREEIERINWIPQR